MYTSVLEVKVWGSECPRLNIDINVSKATCYCQIEVGPSTAFRRYCGAAVMKYLKTHLKLDFFRWRFQLSSWSVDRWIELVGSTLQKHAFAISCCFLDSEIDNLILIAMKLAMSLIARLVLSFLLFVYYKLYQETIKIMNRPILRDTQPPFLYGIKQIG